VPDVSAQIDRLVIPAAKIDAPFQVKGVNARNEMENPDRKDAVAWYDFSARPGFGSNAVFSGHIDWYTGERGVFWFLRNLNEGDEVFIRLTDGTTLIYRVAHTEVVNVSDVPVGEIVGPTETEAITLITCDGAFSRSTQDYDKRRIVRAHRIS
jgi:LPXTG-site transpeptidase (sortase) family protein